MQKLKWWWTFNSRVIDEDRRLNAKRLDEQFYGALDESSKDTSSGNDKLFANLIEFMSDENNGQQLQALLTIRGVRILLIKETKNY